MTRENKHLTDAQISNLKDKLLFDKERITNKNAATDAYCLDKNELSDPVDEASINIQTSQALRFRNRENFYLKKINKTLSKVVDCTYGLCEDCDGEITFERLRARPTAELCIACKEEAESIEQSNFHKKKSKSLGKTIAEL